MIFKKCTLAAVSLAAMALPVRADVIVRQVPGIVFEQMPALVQQMPLVRQTTTFVVPMQTRTITSSAVVSESTLGAVSNFSHRLDMLRDQITRGEEQGLLNTTAAAALLSRYQALADDVSSNPTMLRDYYDAFEQQINVLNQDVSNAMSR